MAVSDDGRLWVAFTGSDPAQPLVVHRGELRDHSYLGTLDGRCAGVIAFDGSTWEQHLAGSCVTHVSAAPGGNVWVTVVEGKDLAEWDADANAPRLDLERAPQGLYVITPEAVAGTE